MSKSAKQLKSQLEQIETNTAFTYGRHDTGTDYVYAVARGVGKQHGLWDVCEIDGAFYRFIDFDEIPECDWDRIDKLERTARTIRTVEVINAEVTE